MIVDRLPEQGVVAVRGLHRYSCIQVGSIHRDTEDKQIQQVTEIVPGKMHPIEVGASERREAFHTLFTLISVGIELG